MSAGGLHVSTSLKLAIGEEVEAELAPVPQLAACPPTPQPGERLHLDTGGTFRVEVEGGRVRLVREA